MLERASVGKPREKVMQSKTALVAAMISLGGLALSAGSAAAQSSSLRQQLVGTWTYAGGYNLMPDGRRIDVQGPSGKGILMMDCAGHFSWTLIRSDLPRFAAN